MSTFVPGAEDSAGAGQEQPESAVRQEIARLREVFEAIQEAVLAATSRLEALEGRFGALPASGDGPAKPAAAGRASRGAAWKLSGWTPAPGTSVVTGETLRARREALGISQAAVAHAAHCSRGLVAEVERGKRRSAQTLAHLATVLDRLEQQARRN